ncbi:MAG: hypothetical protein QS748_14575 [Candidatus Endonucleobacter bathymodioli]|uniref:Uncharacterized protein n=1 Tax=Candidatus Endonucleibacter bathymodioli TaxID=539814 RepID=A0AA90SZ40_9GAMM|nr:hypothetical protein [Candidatus Endonucleobacter bathymodioli]
MRHIEKVEPEGTHSRFLPKTNVRPLMNKRLYPPDSRRKIPDLVREKSRSFQMKLSPKTLRRDLSTVKRELARNTGARGYRPKQAHNFAQERHQQKPKATKMVAELKDKITDRLSKQWSPEQIQGRP